MDRIEFDGDEVKYWMGQCARLEQRLADLKADRQPQKIADAVEVALGDDGHCVVYKNAAVKEAIRQALGSTQERGEAVAWGVQKTGEDGVWFVSDSRFTAQHYATAYAHRVSDGKPDQAVIPLYAAPTDAQSRIAELEAQLALAYGLLWHVNAGMDAPHGTPSLTPERGAMESRKILRDLLTHEQRGDGINAARNYMVALAAEKEGE